MSHWRSQVRSRVCTNHAVTGARLLTCGMALNPTSLQMSWARSCLLCRRLLRNPCPSRSQRRPQRFHSRVIIKQAVDGSHLRFRTRLRSIVRPCCRRTSCSIGRVCGTPLKRWSVCRLSRVRGKGHERVVRKRCGLQEIGDPAMARQVFRKSQRQMFSVLSVRPLIITLGVCDTLGYCFCTQMHRSLNEG